ncbi:hypothetical protein ES332_A09G154200v1 [Gossypium tomentosum]|uniref:Uncharacterized protein n=1 Tax=Gossypium tomentosum TaxID=34277 RepID=A0A5D2P5G9_GOSTO|nr:hypothetical protein ES332_A09G154200v1 [Gossypium tomentosum]
MGFTSSGNLILLSILLHLSLFSRHFCLRFSRNIGQLRFLGFLVFGASSIFLGFQICKFGSAL